MEKKTKKRKICSGIFLIFGTTVGAGMLGIPAMTAGVGFIPAFFVTVFVWIFMLVTGLLLMEAVFTMPAEANLISLAGRFLGKKSKWIVGVLFLFLYGCLLVAYFSGGAPLLGQFFTFCGLSLSPITEKVLFLLFFGGLIFSGAHWIGRVNALLALIMLVVYAVLIGIGSKEVELSRLTSGSFSLAIWAVPVLFSAFGYHNVVPSLVHYLKKDKKSARISLVLGTFLALLFYLVWQWLVLGSVSSEALFAVRAKGLPVTYALQEVSGNRAIYTIGQMFAFLALITSFLGVGLSFVDFLRDGFQEYKKEVSRSCCSLLTVLPPFICVVLMPGLFEKALGVAGGFGESILNGILPVLLFIKIRSIDTFKKGCLTLLLAISVVVIVLETLALCRG